jgi:1-deoxy-D-xylulose-5-phosphate synthase
MTYSEAFGKTAVRLAEADKRVVGITAAMPTGTRLDLLQEAFPDRFYDVGIAEEHAVTFAAGMAQAGLRPIVAIYSTFLQRSIDQVIHDVCLQNLPVMFCLDRAGIVPGDGSTHQGVFDIAYLREIPNLVLMAPSDERELARMMVTAHQLNAPAAIRYPSVRGTGIGLGTGLPPPLPVGKAEVVRDGQDAAILALGPILHCCLKAAEALSGEGIECRVVDARFAKPIDEDLVTELVRENQPLITVEEHTLAGGFGSAVLEVVSAHLGHVPPVLRLGVPDRFVEHGSRRELFAELGLDAESIARRVRTFIHEHVEHTAK